MLMTKTDLLQTGAWGLLAALWAGVSLAGNLVAAPAKFQVEALHLPMALQVGRAQFTWIGIVEWGLLALIVIVLSVRFQVPPLLLLLPALIFLTQQFYLQPLLQERSDILISGQDLPSSPIHLVFAALEVVKFVTLLLYSGITLAVLIGAARLTSEG